MLSHSRLVCKDVTRASSLVETDPNRSQPLLIGLRLPDLAPVCSGLGGGRHPPQLASSRPGPARSLSETREAGPRKPGPGSGPLPFARRVSSRARAPPLRLHSCCFARQLRAARSWFRWGCCRRCRRCRRRRRGTHLSSTLDAGGRGALTFRALRPTPCAFTSPFAGSATCARSAHALRKASACSHGNGFLTNATTTPLPRNYLLLGSRLVLGLKATSKPPQPAPLRTHACASS